jgi:hypothetical protein
MKKIAITSIAPGHKNFENQYNAVKSWHEHGFHVISMNHTDEIQKLQSQFMQVEFVETNRTNELLFGKPFVIVSAIIDYLKTRKETKFLLINSDIVIYDSWNIERELYQLANEGVVVLNRFNYEDEFRTAKRYDGGFDAFLINSKFLNIFPQTVLCLGQCYWDYWLPYQCLIHNVPVITHKKAYIFHKSHDVHYSKEQYTSTANIFKSEVGTIDKTIKQHMTESQLSSHVYYRILNSMK